MDRPCTPRRAAALCLGLNLFMPLALAGCHAGEDAPPDGHGGWLKASTTTLFQGVDGGGHAFIGGTAFVSPGYVAVRQSGVCGLLCTYDDAYPGVDVAWTNHTLGTAGPAGSSYGTATGWQHAWSASVPLAMGLNTIVVSARDPAGTSASVTLTVTYVDVTAPTVKVMSPAAGATGIAGGTSIAATFSEEMEPGSISTATFLLREAGGDLVSGSVGFAGRVATFTPTARLRGLTTYEVDLTSGMKDLVGNALETTRSWTFTTGVVPDTTPPVVSSTTPLDGGCALVEASLGATFSEPVLGSSVNPSTFLVRDALDLPVAGTVGLDAAGRAVFTPGSRLASATHHTAMLTTGITDLAGNPLASSHSWAFTTPLAGTGAWTAMDTTLAPSQRSLHTAVWTGTELIVWGGQSLETGALGDGARYDPVAASWRPVSSVGAPSARTGHVAVWTGRRMIVWGGVGPVQGPGGSYDPATDTWTAISSIGSPFPRHVASAVWTGTEMIVWGGADSSGGPQGDGGRYDPVADAWSPVSSTGAPAARYWHAAVWTGSAMLIWGGSPEVGGIYRPATDSWTVLPTLGAPAVRLRPVAAWTGREMLVWGGEGGIPLDSGGRFDPATETWRPISSACAPAARSWHSGAWTGTELIVWGGSGGSGALLQTGGRYDPARDTWLPTPVAGAPHPRYDASATWCGTELIVWGGRHNPIPGSSPDHGTGASYRPQP